MAKIKTSEYMQLRDLYPVDPSGRELFWEYVAESDFDKKFKLVEFNPVIAYDTWQDEGMIISEAHKRFMSESGFEEIRGLQRFKGLKKMIILVYREEVVDGFHRLAAMARKGITSARALDLSQRFSEPKVADNSIPVTMDHGKA